MSEIDEEKYNQEWVDAMQMPKIIKSRDHQKKDLQVRVSEWELYNTACEEQIKELTVLLEQCEVLAFQDDAEDYIERWQEYTSKVSQYRQKYPKP